MSEPGSHSAPPKLDPESLVLKASPRRVVRFKRNLLIGLAAIGCLVIAGITWIALNGAKFHPKLGSGSELYNAEHQPLPGGLAALPSTYGQLPKPKSNAKSLPRLGPPLPGDLGPPIVLRERSLGLNPSGGPGSEDQAERAEQLRLAQQARRASEAGVFFQLTTQVGAGAANVPPSGGGMPGSSAAKFVTTDGAATGGGAPPVGHQAANRQNDREKKRGLVSPASSGGIYDDHRLRMPISPDEVMAGTVIPASLITGLNSDLPGTVIAQVTENVYDTVTGRILLIPQGSRLIGTYSSVVAFGQNRAFVVWQRIIMPDGASIRIDNLPATDAAGYTGLKDGVDDHTWTLLKGVVLSTLLGVGTQATFGTSQSNLVQAISQSTQESTNQAGQRIVEKDLNVQPTITIRPGWPLRVIADKDLLLRPYQG